MTNEKRLIDVKELIHRIVAERDAVEIKTGCDIGYHNGLNMAVSMAINAPTVEAEEVAHGRWEKEGGDLHSSGYAVRCSVCNDVYFVHHKFALGALTAEVLFKKPKYCPNCGAKMDGDGNADV